MLFTSICFGCKKDHWLDCFKSTGKLIAIERPVTTFTQIELNNNVDLVYHQDSMLLLRISAGENLINGITAKVENNTLVIKNENKCNWVRDFNNKYTVEVFAPDLKGIINYGSGNISFADTLFTYSFQYDNWNASGIVDFKFKCDRIFVNIHTGTADVAVKGMVGMNQLYYNGYGKMDFKDLHTNLTYITNRGSGDCFIDVRDLLEVKILSIGNIYYTGNPPELSANITGTGQLIHL